MSEVIKDFYNNHKAFGINSLRRRKIHALANKAFAGEKKRVLDVGCTSGYVSAPFKDAGHYVVGIDIADKPISEAKKVLNEAYVVDIEHYPWPKEIEGKKFDLIILGEVIEHLFDQSAILQQLKKLLSPGGYILVTTPNLLIWSERVRMLLGTYENKDAGHIRMLSFRTFRMLCEKEGLSIIAEDHVWKPNWLERFHAFLPANMFAYQIVILLQDKRSS